eukprot:scaffold3611_cov131-Isochrysis_galbana.AAC.1
MGPPAGSAARRLAAGQKNILGVLLVALSASAASGLRRTAQQAAYIYDYTPYLPRIGVGGIGEAVGNRVDATKRRSLGAGVASESLLILTQRRGAIAQEAAVEKVGERRGPRHLVRAQTAHHVRVDGQQVTSVELAGIELADVSVVHRTVAPAGLTQVPLIVRSREEQRFHGSAGIVCCGGDPHWTEPRLAPEQLWQLRRGDREEGDAQRRTGHGDRGARSQPAPDGVAAPNVDDGDEVEAAGRACPGGPSARPPARRSPRCTRGHQGAGRSGRLRDHPPARRRQPRKQGRGKEHRLKQRRGRVQDLKQRRGKKKQLWACPTLASRPLAAPRLPSALPASGRHRLDARVRLLPQAAADVQCPTRAAPGSPGRPDHRHSNAPRTRLPAAPRRPTPARAAGASSSTLPLLGFGAAQPTTRAHSSPSRCRRRRPRIRRRCGDSAC